jgi:transketolase
MIIADTVKGKGVSFMENSYVWHAKVPNKQELAEALIEIGGRDNHGTSANGAASSHARCVR